MSARIKIWIPLEFKVKRANLLQAARTVREKFELADDEAVYMEDLLWELELKNVVEFPDFNASDDFRIDEEWKGPLTDGDLK